MTFHKNFIVRLVGRRAICIIPRAIAICAYDASTLNKSKDPINLYTDLVKAHGTVLFAGIDNKLGKVAIRKV